MTSKNKSGSPKDIDDVLSSIDSLLDTAIDVKADDLPVLDLESDSEAKLTRQEQNEPKMAVPQKTSGTRKSVTRKKVTKRKVTKATGQTKKKKTVIKNPASQKRVAITKKQTQKTNDRPNAGQSSTEPDSKLESDGESKTIEVSNKQVKNNTTESDSGNNKASLKDNNSESKPNSSSNSTDFSLVRQELPVLDEIITEEEMALIAAGKELPRRVITEKFAPKTTTDKIIELLTIHLSDYNITRLEYEYLHELIDELLEEEKNKPK